MSSKNKEREEIYNKIRNPLFYHNISTLFLLPLLNPKFNWIYLKENYGFITSFKWKKDEKIVQELYLIFKNSELYKLFYNKYYDFIVEEEDVKNYIVCTMNIDDKWKEDLSKILQGKYSKTSEEFKNLFKKEMMYTHTDDQSIFFENIVYLILNRDIKMINIIEKKFQLELTLEDFNNNMELWTLMNEENETLDFDNINIKKYE